MEYLDTINAKIELRNAGWKYNRKRRQWQYSVEDHVVTAETLHEALAVHRRVQEIARSGQ